MRHSVEKMNHLRVYRYRTHHVTIIKGTGSLEEYLVEGLIKIGTVPTYDFQILSGLVKKKF
jgi:hypothetical protein